MEGKRMLSESRIEEIIYGFFEDDPEGYEKWFDENHEKFSDAYQKGDAETVRKMMTEEFMTDEEYVDWLDWEERNR